MRDAEDVWPREARRDRSPPVTLVILVASALMKLELRSIVFGEFNTAAARVVSLKP